MDNLLCLKFCTFISDLNDEVIKALQGARKVPKVEDEDVKKITDHDMETCFGFDVRSFSI